MRRVNPYCTCADTKRGMTYEGVGLNSEGRCVDCNHCVFWSTEVSMLKGVGRARRADEGRPKKDRVSQEKIAEVC